MQKGDIEIQKSQQKSIENQQNYQINQKDKQRMDDLIKSRDITNKQNKIRLFQQQINSRQLIYVLKLSNYININIIQTLDLCMNKIDDEGIKYISHQQNKWAHLNNLWLHNNQISVKGVQYLSIAAQKKCFSQLKYLKLDSNKIGSFINKSLLKQEEGLILKFANENTKLQQLSLCDNKINDNDLKVLFEANQNNKKVFNNLFLFFLEGNDIKDHGIKQLTDENIQFPKLNRLSFRRNKINVNGVKYLVSSINKNAFKSVKDLSLYDNPLIGDKGVAQFLKGCHLGAFPLLQTLDIKHINLSNNGIQSIIKLFNPTKTLKFIQLIIAQRNRLVVNKKIAFKNLKKKVNSIFV